MWSNAVIVGNKPNDNGRTQAENPGEKKATPVSHSNNGGFYVP